MTRLLLEGMTFHGRHGALAAERELGARFTVDAVIEADLGRAEASDAVADSLDYTQAYSAIGEIVGGEPCNLLETLASRIADRLLELRPGSRVTVTVRKRPPVAGEFSAFGVEVRRP